MYTVVPRFLTFFTLGSLLPKSSLLPKTVKTSNITETYRDKLIKMIRYDNKNYHGWSDLRKYHLNAPPPHLLSRKSAIQQLYDQQRLVTPNYSALLKQRLFPQESTDVVVTTNDFPYDLEDNITHLVVWYRSNNFDELRLIQILEELGIKDYIIFTNTLAGKSIKDIDHTHLFLRDINDVNRVLSYDFNR